VSGCEPSSSRSSRSLVGIPTVVYGFFALTFMTPLLRDILGSNVVEFFNIASAGIVVGAHQPLISSLSEDALRAVPDSLRQAAYALGASKMEVSLRIIVPAALSGIGASIVVAMSRAVGETMVVALAAGAAPRNFTLGEDPLFGYILNPFVPGEAMTGHIVRVRVVTSPTTPSTTTRSSPSGSPSSS